MPNEKIDSQQRNRKYREETNGNFSLEKYNNQKKNF